MRPALSIVFFTALSGSGYGLLFWLGLLDAARLLPAERGFGLLALVLALGFVSVGLFSSLVHLGHPERAWRALSQWRSSWLSREGVAALATYPPALLYGLGWALGREAEAPALAAGVIAALGAVVTVTCTAFIYRSLKPVQRWSNHWVLPNYLALAGMAGALWLAALASLWEPLPPALAMLAIGMVLAAAVLKLSYWRFIDGSASASSAGTATGLGALGEVRLFEAPHTAENYLLKEMGFAIARRHAAKLRRIAVGLAFVLPILLIVVSLMVPRWASAVAAVAAAVLAQLGVLIERWLFFAEAKHSVTLYYGAVRA